MLLKPVSSTAKRLHSVEPPATPDNQRTFRRSTEYRYNIRGWLTGMNDPDATDAMLQYNTPMANGGPAQYNGNISEIIWRSAGGAKQSYGYYYDTLSRIKEARYVNHADRAQDNRCSLTMRRGGSFPGLRTSINTM